MATQAATGSGPYVNNGGTVLNGGNVASNSPVTNNLTVLNTTVLPGDTKPYLAVSPAESSNIGTRKANSSRAFANMEAGEYIGKVITAKVGGVANTTPANTGAEYGHREPINIWRGYFNKGDLTINDSTGVYSYAGGSRVQPSGIDGGVGIGEDVAANPSNAVPGRLVIRVGSPDPVQSSYKARTSN